MSNPQGKRDRNTDSVQVTPQGIRRVRDRVRDRILQERQHQREEGRKPTYTREDLAEQIKISIDTLKRFLKGVKVRRDSAEALTRFLGFEPDDLIEPGRNQRPSEFYVERPDLESECYNILLQEKGALIRVKAPHRLGKTWFVEQLLNQLNQLEETQYRAVTLSFWDAESAVFKDLETFLKWFCISVGNSLEVPNQLEQKWQDDLGNNSNCTNYFETCIWSTIDTPLVLVLDDVDIVFEKQNVADDFCKLLRSWYDRARRVRGGTWRNLRLMIVHSTDIYGALDINYSPLANVGTEFLLRTFYQKEVAQLVQQYQFHWSVKQIEQMMALIGGNPYLVHAALDYLMQRPEMTLEEFLRTAITEISPYHNYLEELLSILQQNSNLASAFKQVVDSATPIRVDSASVFQLYSMGLIEVEEQGVVPSCELYRQYFRNRL